MSENEKRRISQLEEQLSNTLQAVDSLHADVAAFKDYAVENNKVVNRILHKISENIELLFKANERIDANEKRMESNEKRMEANEKILEANQKRIDANEKRMEASEKRMEASEKRIDANEKIIEANQKRMEANQNNIEVLMNELVAEREQRKLEIDTIIRRLDRLENQ